MNGRFISKREGTGIVEEGGWWGGGQSELQLWPGMKKSSFFSQGQGALSQHADLIIPRRTASRLGSEQGPGEGGRVSFGEKNRSLLLTLALVWSSW